MDNRTIFSKTGRGSLEITKKSIKLSSDERQALILVDGKSNLADMEQKLTRIAAPKLRAIFEKLLELDLIREFISKTGPDSLMPTPGSASAAMQVQEISEEDLDFTALAPVASPNSVKEIEARRLVAEAAERQAREETSRRLQEQQARLLAENEIKRKAEAERQARENAERKARDEATARERARMAEEAKRKTEGERLAREAEEQKARAEAEARERARLEEEARRKAVAERLARDAAERKARAEAEARERARLEEEARRKAEAERLAREAAEARERARLAEETRRKTEAERLAREAAERKAREDAEARERSRLEEEARRKIEAERLAREAAERKAREDAEARERARLEEEARRKAEAERKAREDAEARERARLEEEARRKAEAERKAREEAEAGERARLEEEAQRKAEAERKAREEAEARERARLEEETRRRANAEQSARQAAEREAAERKAREETEALEKAQARERARLEEEAVRRAQADRQVKEEAQRKAMEESQRRAREDAERHRREEAERKSAGEARESAQRAEIAARERQSRADEEAARYTAALTPHLEAAAPPAESPSGFNAATGSGVAESPASAGPAPMGAFANLASTESAGPDSLMDGGDVLPDPLDPQPSPDKNRDKRERAALEKENKERARAEARAKKEADREARRQAREGQGSGGINIGLGKLIVGALALVVVGAVGYLFTLRADKPAIEKALSARLGQNVTVGAAKFDPFPPELRLTDVAIGDIRLPKVVAVADSSSLASSEKVWRNVDITGVTLTAAQAGRLAALAAAEPGRAAAEAVTLQRVRVLGVTVSGAAVPLPVFDVTLLVAPNGVLKQATLATPDGKAQVVLAPDGTGWSVDIESRGLAWALGPKVIWEGMRAKGIANPGGIRFDDINLSHFGGSARGSGDLAWNSGWKFNGTLEVGGFDVEGMGNALYGASPVAGGLEGKFIVNLAANSIERLFDAPQVEGNFTVGKAVVRTLDFARAVQGGDSTGQTRFTELSGVLAASGGKLQVRQVRGTSGLLNVLGNVDVAPDRSLSGATTIELGSGGGRSRVNLRIGGTVAEPRLSK